jgi:hypothetical protein
MPEKIPYDWVKCTRDPRSYPILVESKGSFISQSVGAPMCAPSLCMCAHPKPASYPGRGPKKIPWNKIARQIIENNQTVLPRFWWKLRIFSPDTEKNVKISLQRPFHNPLWCNCEKADVKYLLKFDDYIHKTNIIQRKFTKITAKKVEMKLWKTCRKILDNLWEFSMN